MKKHKGEHLTGCARQLKDTRAGLKGESMAIYMRYELRDRFREYCRRRGKTTTEVIKIIVTKLCDKEGL